MPRRKSKQAPKLAVGPAPPPAGDGLDIPDFLLRAKDPAKWAAPWRSAATAPVAASKTELTSSFAALAAARAAERETKRAARIERVKARKAVPDRIAAKLFDPVERIPTARYDAVMRRLPTDAHRDYLRKTWISDPEHGGYRRAEQVISGVVVKAAPQPKTFNCRSVPRPKVTGRPAAPDDVAARTAGLDRKALLALAKANGFYKPSYDALDNGRVTMTVRNVLRGKAKRGEQVKWS